MDVSSSVHLWLTCVCSFVVLYGVVPTIWPLGCFHTSHNELVNHQVELLAWESSCVLHLCDKTCFCFLKRSIKFGLSKLHAVRFIHASGRVSNVCRACLTLLSQRLESRSREHSSVSGSDNKSCLRNHICWNRLLESNDPQRTGSHTNSL